MPEQMIRFTKGTLSFQTYDPLLTVETPRGFDGGTDVEFEFIEDDASSFRSIGDGVGPYDPELTLTLDAKRPSGATVATGLHHIEIDLATADATAKAFWKNDGHFILTCSSGMINGQDLSGFFIRDFQLVKIASTEQIGNTLLSATVDVVTTQVDIDLDKASGDLLPGRVAILEKENDPSTQSRVVIATASGVQVTFVSAPTFTIASGDSFRLLAPQDIEGGLLETNALNVLSRGVVTGTVKTVTDQSTFTTNIAAAASPLYNATDQVIRFTTGANAGSTREIASAVANGGDMKVTLSPPLAIVPSISDAFTIYGLSR